jgi:hypothetical protein
MSPLGGVAPTCKSNAGLSSLLKEKNMLTKALIALAVIALVVIGIIAFIPTLMP